MRKSPYIAQFNAEVFGAEGFDAPVPGRGEGTVARPGVAALPRSKPRPAPEAEAPRLMADGRPEKRSIFDASYAELGFGHREH